jgi:hypothetical protein
VPTSEPYLSIVVVARNDNYGGDFAARMQAFVTTTVELCDREGLDAELIVVEWNPPPDRAPLRQAIAWRQSARCAIRILTVAADLHQALANPARLPLFEFIGKNSGIRRARGAFVLSTNPDVIFSAELVAFLAGRTLRRGCFYRIDRRDVKAPLPPRLTTDQILAYCRANVIRVHRYWASNERRPLLESWPTIKFFLVGLRDSPPGSVHTNAAGDFTLMHRDHWHSVGAYPELESKGRAHHIDSVLVYTASANGLRQIILGGRRRLYHQDHGRVEPAKPPSEEVARALAALRTGLPPPQRNEVNWGLPDAVIAEAVV